MEKAEWCVESLRWGWSRLLIHRSGANGLRSSIRRRESDDRRVRDKLLADGEGGGNGGWRRSKAI